MGQIRFIAPSLERLPDGVENRVYMMGLDGSVWRSESRWEDDQLILRRSLGESGYFNTPWLRSDGQEVFLSTSTLREQEEPYLLEVELARGALNRLRNQASAWGVPLTPEAAEVHAHWEVAVDQFVRAATSYLHDQAVAIEHATKAIEAALDAQHELVKMYMAASLDARRAASRRLHTLFACQVSKENSPTKQAQSFVSAFNAAAVTCRWKEIEVDDGQFDWSGVEAQLKWCKANRLRVAQGPLLCFDKQHLPDWIYLWDDDFDAIVSYVKNYVRQAVAQFPGSVHVREVAGRVNLPGALDLNEEQQLQLVVAALRTARKADPQVPLVVGFCQPWAEYLAHDNWEISPMHVADALLRAEIGVSGFTLEINYGYQAHGSSCRDLLELSQMIDRWSQLGAPLLIRLVLPSASSAEVVADFQTSEQVQQRMLSDLIHLLLCKPAVHGIIYQQWRDQPSSGFAHGGLVQESGAAKPVLQSLIELRQANLQ